MIYKTPIAAKSLAKIHNFANLLNKCSKICNFVNVELLRHNIAVHHEMRKDSHFKEIS